MSRDPIAIVGIGCRLPGGGDGPDAFWKLLCDGRDAVVEVPPDRWNADTYYDPTPGRIGKSITRWGGFVDAIDQFDPGFFGISPREAEFMDPQQRMLLETAWQALEDGGQRPDRLRGSATGVFIGISTHDYELLQSSPDERSDVDIYSTTGGVPSIAANRLSYVFDFRGPSIAIDTACSSSLIAVHLACRSLWSGECSLALAGGVNALLAPMPFVAFSRMSMLSPTGRCKAFDASADGFVRGEGAGIVVLKTLSRARADRDPIYAVIRGTAANQDGRTNGITVPSVSAQAALVRRACVDASVLPSAIDYVEAHGTGTPVGDPIEARALGEALGMDGLRQRPCVVGSVKTNIGHLEAGAGIAGIIKLALVLKHGEVPPNLHFKTPNPAIDFAGLKLVVPTSLAPLSSADGDEPPLAGINSFGFGGSNAHAILQAVSKPPRRRKPPQKERAELLVISGRSPEALSAMADRYRLFLAEVSSRGEPPLEAICRSAATRRGHHPHRLAVVGESPRAMADRLAAFVDSPPGLSSGQVRDGAEMGIVFVFSGQGPQWSAMGRELLAEEPVFRSKIEECDAILAEFASWRLGEELARDEASSRLAETAIAQPAIFALQVALAALWRSWGIRPAAVVGHSVGEVAAAHVAGVLRLRDAAHVIFQRGRCMDLAPERGRMLAVGLSPAEAEELIAAYADRVSIGAHNAPSSITLSGDASALEEISRSLERREVFWRFLPVNYAFHSQQMEPVRAELARSLGRFDRAEASVPMFSTVSGGEIADDEIDAQYWWRNVRQTVRFASAIDAAIARGHTTFLEIGPHPVLASSIADCLRHRTTKGALLASLKRKEPERATMLGSLGTLYTLGVPVEWPGLFSDGEDAAALPTYAWQKERYWHESPGSRARRLLPIPHPFLSRSTTGAAPTWETWLDGKELPYLADHRLQGHVVFPAAGYVEMALGAAKLRLGDVPVALEDVDFLRALVLPDADVPPRLELSIDPADSTFRISSRAGEEDWVINCAGTLRAVDVARAPSVVAVDQLRSACSESVTSEEVYERFRQAGLAFGPAFRTIERVARGNGEALGRVRLAAGLSAEAAKYRIHPALLDGCFQVLSAALPEHGENRNQRRLYLPVQIQRLRFFARPVGAVWCHARLVRRGGGAIVGDLRIFDDAGHMALEIRGFRCQAVARARKGGADPEEWLYGSKWERKPLAGRASRAPASDFLPPTARLARVAQDMLSRRGRGNSLRARFLRIEPEIDELCRAYVLAALSALGWRPRTGHRLEGGSLADDLGVAAEHRRVFGRYLDLLEQAGVLARAPRGFTVKRIPAPLDTDARWRSLLSTFPAFHAELTLLRRFGRELATLLRGGADPLQILLSDGSFATLEHFYQDAPSFADYNAAVAEAVSAALVKLPSGRPVRILEIGAGTGGMTAHVLRALPSDRSEYVVSDLSPLFFSRAERKFFDFPFVRCQLFDAEKPGSEQGFEPCSFDLVLASDALHATADLRAALRHVRELLSPQGLFVLLEIDRPTRWIDLVFGLTRGWWRFSDYDLRATYPLLDRERWRATLADSGFEAIEWATDGNGPDRSGQTIFLARAPNNDRPLAVQSPAPPPEGRQSWLVFADETGIGDRLARLLAARGDSALVVFAGAAYRRRDDACVEIRPESPEDVRRLFAELERPPSGIVHLWSLDAIWVGWPDRSRPRDQRERGETRPAAETTLDSLADSEARGCLTVLHVVQALSEGTPPRLWLVTRGSQPVGDGAQGVSPAQAPLWGLGRVIQNEQRRLRCRMIDLDPRGSVADAERLVDELTGDDPEDEVALRGDERYANRLVRTSLAAVMRAKTAGAYRLEMSCAGVLDRVSLAARSRRKPAKGELEIEVRAAALNFRDVMKALGIYPSESDDDLLLGDECAGRVVAVGRGTGGFREGDEVIAMAPGCFASHLTLEASRVARKPSRMTFEEAATVPVTFLTSWYALHELGRIRRGETVLLQAATGGVGLSALQIARLAGAKIYATAGSAEKRELLRALGVDHVMDSRSLAFEEEVMAATGGRGVDLVLNSLAGDAIAKGLAVLAPHGRFLEIGKRDIYQNTRIGLRPFRNSTSMFVIDLPQVMRDQPELVRALMARILGLFRKGELAPLPYRIFPISAAASALRWMATAQHVGKIVLSMDDTRARPVAGAAEIRFAAKASYLVTGGLGGFGLAVAEWIVRNGGRNLVLVGRGGASTPEARRAVASLRRRGARVTVVRADVARERDVATLFRRLARSGAPLRGIIHAAMVLDDGLLTELDADRFRRVTAPKVRGAWNLHRHSRDLALDFFVMFSSVSSIVGAPAQANYVAANAFLDALAHHRRSLGLTALTINWGQLGEVGYVARHARVEQHLTRQGILGIPPDEALRLLGRLLRSDVGQVGVVRVDWQKWAAFLPAVATAPRYSELFAAAAKDGGEDGRGVREAILDCPAAERLTVATAHLREQVARVLRTTAAKLDPERPLAELGVDSLMAFELLNRIESQLDVALPATKLGANATIARLAALLLDVLAAGPKSAEATRETPIAPAEDIDAECLVTLRDGDGRPPLFCFHPAGGLANIYQPLAARMPGELPLYALRSRVVAGRAAEHATLADLAETYASLIQKRDPRGPHHLVGFSLGGIFALATAEVLERRGADVCFIALVDSDLRLVDPGHRSGRYVEKHVVDMYGIFARELGIVRELGPSALADEAAELSARLMAAPRAARGRTIVDWLTERHHLLPSVSPELLERYFALFEAHVSLVEGFAPPRLRAPLHLWSAAAGDGDERGRLEAWERSTAASVVHRTVDGGHYDLMYPPRVEVLAAEIAAALERIANGRGGAPAG